MGRRVRWEKKGERERERDLPKVRREKAPLGVSDISFDVQS